MLDVQSNVEEDFAQRCSLQHALAILSSRHDGLKKAWEKDLERNTKGKSWSEYEPLSADEYREKLYDYELTEIDE